MAAESPPSPPDGPALPADAVAAAKVDAPVRGNRRLESFLAAANADDRLRGWWHMQHVFANRLGMSDHSWVHVRVVLNIALRLSRLLFKRGVEPAMVADHLMREHDAEVVIAAGCLFHDTGMSIHRTDHEAYSLFLAADRLPGSARGHLSRARAHRGGRGGPARDHRPPPPRRPDHGRGRDRARGGRARPGPGTLAGARSRTAAPTSTRSRRRPSTRSRSRPERSAR